MSKTTITIELKVTRVSATQVEEDRYGTKKVVDSGGEVRLGHLTLTGSDLADLKERAGRALDEVQDW